MTGGTGGSGEERSADLTERLNHVEQRIDQACNAAGRNREDVSLVVVTKTWPDADVVRLAQLGVTDVGENRDQEASAKAASCAALGLTRLTWHFVGSIQTNKARSIARYADVVHSVDRREVAQALSAGAVLAERQIDVLIQVSLDEAPGRGGVAPGEVVALAEVVAGLPGVRVRGVMGVAPRPTGTPQDGSASARRAFDALAAMAADLRSAQPAAAWISAGMSGDLEEAVGAGATHLRVGTAILGSRPALL